MERWGGGVIVGRGGVRVERWGGGVIVGWGDSGGVW